MEIMQYVYLTIVFLTTLFFLLVTNINKLEDLVLLKINSFFEKNRLNLKIEKIVFQKRMMILLFFMFIVGFFGENKMLFYVSIMIVCVLFNKIDIKEETFNEIMKNRNITEKSYFKFLLFIFIVNTLILIFAFLGQFMFF